MNKANITSDSCQVLDLDISLFQGNFNTRVYDKRNLFFFPYHQFVFIGWRRSFDFIMWRLHFSVNSFCTYICISNNVSDFNGRNLVIKDKLLHQGYRFHKLLKTFTKLYCRYLDLVYKYNSTYRDLIKKGISHTCIYGDVIFENLHSYGQL